MSEQVGSEQNDIAYAAATVGPDARWVVFLCADQGHPMDVGYEADEYADAQCPCGAKLVPVTVMPVKDN